MDIRINSVNIDPALSADRFLDRAGKLSDVGGVPKASEAGASFVDSFKDAMQAVEGLQSDANSKVQQMLAGGEGQELHTTMIAVEKADLAFQLMMQVRNKIVQEYQEVSRMPF